ASTIFSTLDIGTVIRPAPMSTFTSLSSLETITPEIEPPPRSSTSSAWSATGATASRRAASAPARRAVIPSPRRRPAMRDIGGSVGRPALLFLLDLGPSAAPAGVAYGTGPRSNFRRRVPFHYDSRVPRRTGLARWLARLLMISGAALLGL